MEFHQMFPYNIPDNSRFEVTLNFSDPQGLFFHCWSNLFAQDEIQTMDFPLLLHLKAYAERNKPSILSFDSDKAETTIVKNVSRFGIINTTGIYGYDFAGSSQEKDLKQTATIEKTSRYNILAMPAFQAASNRKNQIYDTETIQFLFEVAYTGFESAHMESDRKNLVINTGNWGAGAFGHDPLLMAVIQMITAECVGVTELNYFLPDWRTHGIVEKAKEWIQKNIYEMNSQGALDLKTICEIMAGSGTFKYGSSDGC